MPDMDHEHEGGSMNDLEQIRHIKPCANGCIRKGTEDSDQPQLLAATHGHFCDREFYRITGALDVAAELVEHVLAQIGGISAPKTDGSQRIKRNPPLPFNVEAFNDANEIYSRLVYWSSMWATRLGRPIPVPAARAWRSQGNRVVGLPYDIAPNAARYAVSIMATWLKLHADDIFDSHRTDDVNYYIEELRDIYRVNAKFPREEQPQRGDVGCPSQDCGGQLMIFAPTDFREERRVVCQRCGRHIEPKDYQFMLHVVDQMKAEQAAEVASSEKHKRAAAHLLRKYGRSA